MVDDSRAARVVLSRTLESFGVVVDALESAELALDYLQHSQPDVIFMDYLLTGMDGLAAVRIIKANPATRHIPIFMYSSQQDPAFAQTARVAGALGVLSKTFKNTDVANLLQQARAANQGPSPPAVAYAMQPVNPHLARAQRIAVIALTIALALGIGWLMYSNHRLQQQLAKAQAQHKVNILNATESSSSSRAALSMSVSTVSQANHVVVQDSETVPYGEVPLAGSRLERLKSMLNALQARGFKGVLRVEVFTGDFCLQGNMSGGYHIAPAELSIKQCDLLGNPFADVLSVQQRQSADFASFIASLNPYGAIRIQLADGGRQLAMSYPPQSSGLTAGQWNLSAARNNRVEFSAIAAE